MQPILEFLPFVIPLLIIELLLAITSVVHILKHPNYRFGSRTLWILIVLLIQIIGPAVYFIFGRGEE